MEAREALIQLNLIPGLGAATIHRLLAAFDCPEAIFRASPTLLEEILRPYARRGLVERIGAAPRGAALSQELERVEKAGARVVTLFDSEYPESLRNISDPPPVLYVKGTLIPEDAVAMAVVGTRSASAYGLTAAREFAQGLVRSGITVVSGLAEGIDGAAHEGALTAGGRTIAVLGNGLAHVYPPQHRDLAQRITQSGALISEFPMQMEPAKENFPRRNRVIAGLSLGVMVVEAPLRSGALITAREALEQGREVFAVPGPISSLRSQGCHQLLKEGAKLAEELSDILEELAPQLKERLNRMERRAIDSDSFDGAQGKRPVTALTQEESVVYESIPVGSGVGVDTLAQAATMPPARLLPVLTALELKGLVTQLPGQGYSRKGSPARHDRPIGAGGGRPGTFG